MQAIYAHQIVKLVAKEHNNVVKVKVLWCRGLIFPYYVAVIEKNSYYIIDPPRVSDTLHVLYNVKRYGRQIEAKYVVQFDFKSLDEFIEYLSLCNAVVKTFTYDYDVRKTAIKIGVGPKPFCRGDKRFSIVTPMYRIYLSPNEFENIKQYLTNCNNNDVIMYDMYPYNIILFNNRIFFYRSDIDKIVDGYIEVIKSIINRTTPKVRYEIIYDINRFIENVEKELKNLKNTEVEKIVNFANALRSIVPTKS